ncbi:hypothetical protein LJR175_004393 [Variovorax sp. LjRoot175]|uniref:hypothetical protein n=1 Tax=Variovorax sp. LjRoot175 TaxID=3342276 RepID=UPI003ECCE26A
MTSPVDTSVKNFNSSMANAPVLSGTAGSLIALLDACLKDGFNTVALSSLVVAGGVATATYTGTHAALVDSVVLIAGVTGGPTGWADLNGEQKIVTKPGATSVTFATALPDGTATGTITMKMAPLGFTKPFTGTNKAAYKSSDPASTGCYLRIDDAGTTSCRVVGYETMTDVDTGTGPFPTAAQMSGGGYWAKSSAANSTANTWALVGDGRFFLLFVAPYSGATPAWFNGFTRGFGDPIAYKPAGDAYFCALNYAGASGISTMHDGCFDVGTAVQTATPRSYTGLGSSALHASYPYTGIGSAPSGSDSTMGIFPSLVDATLRLARRYLASGTGQPARGELPGLFHVPQSECMNTFRTLDKTVASGTLNGRKLLALNPTNNPGATLNVANTGVSFVDITGPWR